MATTTMQVVYDLFGTARPKGLTLTATPHFVSMFYSPDRLSINLIYTPTVRREILVTR